MSSYLNFYGEIQETKVLFLSLTRDNILYKHFVESINVPHYDEYKILTMSDFDKVKISLLEEMNNWKFKRKIYSECRSIEDLFDIDCYLEELKEGLSQLKLLKTLLSQLGDEGFESITINTD